MKSGRALRRAEVVGAAILWAVLCVGAAVMALTAPVYTSSMTRALDVSRSSGLSGADVSQLSGAARALVADANYDPLPITWRGYPAFDQAAVSHLLDVRTVVTGARIATGAAFLLLLVYVGAAIGFRRLDRLREGLRVAAGMLSAAVLLAVVAAFTDFEWLFTRFHGLFFTSGTWTFPVDSMLIRLFPESFWVASGACWAALVMLAAVLLWAVARGLRSAL